MGSKDRNHNRPQPRTASAKRRFATAGLVLLLAASLLGCMLAVAYVFIPSYVESRLIPEITSRLGGNAVAFRIRRIHFNGTDLGPIVIGDPRYPALAAESVHIDYTPSQVLQGHVARIVISGVTLHAVYQDGAITLRGIDIQELIRGWAAGDRTEPGSGGFVDAIAVDGLALRSAQLDLTRGGKTVRIPFEIAVTPENARLEHLDVNLTCFPMGGEISASGRVDLRAARIAVDFNAKTLDLARYADIVDPVPGLEMSGLLDVNGKAAFSLDPFHIAHATATARFVGTRIFRSSVTLTHSRQAPEGETPIVVSIDGGSDSGWTLSGSTFAIVAPVPVHFEALDVKVKIGSGALEGSGTFSIGVAPSAIKPPVSAAVADALKLVGRIEASWADPGEWAFVMDNHDPETRQAVAKELRISAQGVDLTARLPSFRISGSGNQEKGAVDVNLAIPEVAAANDRAVLTAADITLSGHARIEDLSGHPAVFSDLDMSAGAVKYKQGAATATIPRFTVKGKLSGRGTGIDRFDALATLSDATVSDADHGIRADGVQGRLPVHWPLEGKGEKGTVAVSGIKWQGRAVGAISAGLQQNGRGLEFSGTHASRILPNLKVQFSGNAGLSPAETLEAAVAFSVPGFTPPEDIDLGTVVPSAKGVRMGGELALEGRFFLNADGAAAGLRTTLKNGRLLSEQMGFHIAGIDVAVVVPDLFQVRSAPAQQLRFQTAQIGALKMDMGQAAFQIESDGSLFVENGSFQWCGGHVDTGATRISPGKDDYRIVLYCDRLLLAGILEQFGAVQAEGSGTLSGKIPVRFENGRLSFDDGFLFSSPGEGGSIRVRGTEILTAGIPRDTLQYTQLELAREALKDYTYDWVKLALDTQGDTLLLRMQMNGKPDKALPFVYDKKIGGFAKVAAGGKGSIFQGISLDVNFNLPLDKLLTYKDILKTLE